MAFQGRPFVGVSFAEPIWASGHTPHQQAGHMTAIDLVHQFLAALPLTSRGRPHMQVQGSALVLSSRLWITTPGAAPRTG